MGKPDRLINRQLKPHGHKESQQCRRQARLTLRHKKLVGGLVIDYPAQHYPALAYGIDDVEASLHLLQRSQENKDLAWGVWCRSSAFVAAVHR